MVSKKNIFLILLKLLILICIPTSFLFSNLDFEINETKQSVFDFFVKDKSDTNLILKFNKLREYFSFYDPYSGLTFYNDLIKNPSSLNSSIKRGLIYNSIAAQYTQLRQYEIAAKYYFQSITEIQKSGNNAQLAWNYIDVGNLYYNYKQFNEAINYYISAIKILENSIKDYKNNTIKRLDTELGIAVATENIGLCMQEIGKYDSALYYIRKSEKIRLDPQQPKINKQYYYSTLGFAFFVNKMYDSSLHYSKLSIEIDPKKELREIDLPEHYRFKSNSEILIGQCFVMMNQKEQGTKYFKQSLKTLEYYTSKAPLLNAYIKIATFLLNNGYTKDAYNYLMTGQSIGHNHKELFEQYFSLLRLKVDVLTKLKQIDKAKKIQDTIIVYLDSLANRVSSQNIVLAKIDVELQNNLQKLELARIEKEFQNKQISDQKLIVWLLIVIAIILIGLFLLVYYLYLQRQKSNKQLTSKNDELNKANEKLNESLELTEKINSELVASHEELANTNYNLETSNQTKNTLFSIIAHDLKNAIGGVRTLNQLLVDDFENYERNEIEELIQLMNNSSKNMYNLLENLLLWSSSQRGIIKTNKDLNYPNFIINNNFNLYSQAASEKNLELVNLIPNDFAFVFDASLFDTITRNLINNAIKFSNDGGKIMVSCSAQGDEVQFCVSDNGVGMPQEKANKIFNIDANKSTTGTKGEKGTGLGLMVCYDFVKMHNGRIWFESEVGKGTKVYFTFEYLKP